MNKQILPNRESVTATSYFSDWLCQKMAAFDVTSVELAKYVGVDRKTIYAWCSGARYPKLDALAKIFRYFDCETIEIPLGGET